ncbi:MAG: hypothetical protein E7273_03595 [Pseudobutyrivibrio ruminis]|nr:hypothetical protein [Pseudobutyrivibrio ruminis]
MADFLTENSFYYQSMSSGFGFSNFANSLGTSLSTADAKESFKLPDISAVSSAGSYTRVVSATVMSSQMMAQTGTDGRVAYSYQGVMQKFEIRIDVNGYDRTYTAVGTDKDGNPFSKEIDPYNVDPTDSDFTEFAALCTYICNTENIADEAMNFVSEIADSDIFKQMDYLSAFSTNISKYEMMGFSNLTAESLMPHINSLMEVLMNSGMSGSVGAISTLNFEYVESGVTEKVEEAETSEDETTVKAMTAEDVLKMLMEKYQKIDHSDEEDWRKISDEEWEKLLAKVDSDIEEMQEYLAEEEEKVKQEQIEEQADVKFI